jgi:two-component system, sensor histidine kinase
MVGPARIGGIMAPKSRSKRPARTAKKRSPKKRASGAAARKARSERTALTDVPGMVEAALAAFAHEVRTPLTGILAISNLLATSDLDERERRWVDTIRAGAEHLASLATLFVDAARSGASGLGVRQDLFDLRALARSIGDSPAGPRPRACNRRSNCRRNFRRPWSAIRSGCAPHWKT